MNGEQVRRSKTAQLERLGRSVRADAQRNDERLLRAAMTVFAASGVNAPMRAIADQAGVGVGTLYRHFPTRADLIVSVFRHEVDACADAASVLAAQHEPHEALTRWVDCYIDFLAAKRGLAGALHSGDPAYDALPSYFLARLGPALDDLLKTAAARGAIRNDVSAMDLLWTVASLCAPTRTSDTELAKRMIGLVLDGLRTAPCTSLRQENPRGSS